MADVHTDIAVNRHQSGISSLESYRTSKYPQLARGHTGTVGALERAPKSPPGPGPGNERTAQALRPHAGSGSDFDTDQSRNVYLVRLISIWYCNWFMLFMTLDMPDEGTR